MNKELQETVKIYKIIIPIIILILLTGIIISIFTVKKSPAEKPLVQPPAVEQVVNQTQVNQTQVNQTQVNQTVQATEQINETVRPEQVNQTVAVPTATVVPINTSIKYTWEGITVQFPDSLKRVTTQYATHHYINITEADNTPLSNEKQFMLEFYVVGTKKSQIIPMYQNKQWLVSLMMTNKGKYLLEITIKCADKRGHCQRMYPEGSTTRAFDFEVV